MFRSLLYKAFAILGSREVQALEKDSIQPRAAQRNHLLQIVRANAESEYGKQYRFASIKSIEDYQTAVPINDYDALQPYILRSAEGQPNILTAESPFMFATTSGTTGARKLIPITRAYVKEFRRASVVSGYNLLKNYPGVARGVSLAVFSSAQESLTSAGIPVGAISGRLYLEEPKLIKKFVSPIPYEVFLIDDYESRYYTLLRCALVLPISSIYTLNPSTIMILAKRLETYAQELINDVRTGQLTPPGHLSEAVHKSVAHLLKPEPARALQLQALLDRAEFLAPKVWTDLSLISCWTKASAAFYLEDFPQYFGQTPVCDITYGASEGRGTVCLAPGEQMLSIRSHFFEFVPEDDLGKPNAQVLVADQLQSGHNYYILFTTSAGLYRYNLNDIVKVVGWHNSTPLLEFLHKGGNISSFTGEKVTESQVTAAVRDAARELHFRIAFFSVLPQFRPEPHYQAWIEFAGPSQGEQNEQSLDQFDTHPSLDQAIFEERKPALAAAIDRQLGLHNIEYQTKRDSNRLAPLVVRILRPGTYDSLRRNLVAGGVPDAQIKISHLNPKPEIVEALTALQFLLLSATDAH
jgi:hypothetical protein